MVTMETEHIFRTKSHILGGQIYMEFIQYKYIHVCPYVWHARIKYLSRFDLELAKLAQKKLELAFCAYFASSVAFMRRNTHFFQQNHFFF